MEIEDLSHCDPCNEANITEPPRLYNLTSLNTVFRDFTSEDHSVGNSAGLARQLRSHHPLPCFIGRCENLTSLRILFNKLDKRTRFVDWTSVHLAHLKTVELQNLEISERSLLTVITPSAGSLSELSLNDTFLFDGTWAYVYQSLVDLNCIMDIRSLRGELNRLRNWIRCGDLTGLAAEWRELDVIGYKVKTYLAGQNPGIDCSAVMNEMFLNEDGKNYTYTLSKETRRIVRISHRQEEISLREHSGRVWRATKNFSDLITLNRKFLLGQIPETPYHRGQIDVETIPLVPGLLKLHDFGLFTIGSQPYNHEVDKNCNKLREWQQDNQRITGDL